MTMAEPARSELRKALAAAAAARHAGDLDSAWRHLERAHILSQPWAFAHVRVHAVMLIMAASSRDAREAVGQMVRLVVAAPGSFGGRFPEGNSGRARLDVRSYADPDGPRADPEQLAMSDPRCGASTEQGVGVIASGVGVGRFRTQPDHCARASRARSTRVAAPA